MATVKKITASLWFDTRADEAANFYTSIFKNSSIGRKSYYGKEGFEVHGMPEGTVLTIEFKLEDQAFIGLNGGPHFRFNEAVSFVVNCNDQQELDYYWEQLGAGGDEKAQQCGWLKDKFGLSWQIVPTAMADMMDKGSKAQTGRLMTAMLKMKKLDITALEKAFNG